MTKQKIQSGGCERLFAASRWMRRAEPAVDTTRSTVNLPGRAEQKARAAAAPTAKRRLTMFDGFVGLENDQTVNSTWHRQLHVIKMKNLCNFECVWSLGPPKST